MTLEKQNCVKEEKSKFDISMVGLFDKIFLSYYEFYQIFAIFFQIQRASFLEI